MNFNQWLGDASSLWLSLGALIGIAVLVVLMFNAFQGRARRGASRLKDDPSTRTVDPAPAKNPAPGRHHLGLEGRVEPSFGAQDPVDPQPEQRRSVEDARTADPSFDARFPPDIEPDGSDPAPVSPEPTRDDPLPETGIAASRSGVTAQRRAQEDGNLPLAADWGVLDDRSDCVAVLHMTPAVDCIALRSGAQTLSRIGSKSVIAEVQLTTGGWCDVRAAEGLAAQMRVGILLANRQGPLSASEFAEFAEKLRRLAGKLGVPDLRLPETMGVLERARQVDEFCARLDTLIGVNVLSATRIPAARLAEIAQGLQMTPRGHQRFARTAQSGDVLFTLGQAERPEMLTFVLDVPRAPAAEQPWSRMVEAARRCAELLDARVVDDAMAPLSDAASQAVARQLQSHYAQLAGAGLDAGSPAALRVFN